MTFRGRVKQGVIVLDTPGQLPEGTEVEIRPADHHGVPASSTELDSQDDQALVFGSVAATVAILPREDFRDWEK
jgi:hypothetical protein